MCVNTLPIARAEGGVEGEFVERAIIVGCPA